VFVVGVAVSVLKGVDRFGVRDAHGLDPAHTSADTFDYQIEFGDHADDYDVGATDRPYATDPESAAHVDQHRLSSHFAEK
jgi:hypothetical protein